jgi:hypothetical protein
MRLGSVVCRYILEMALKNKYSFTENGIAKELSLSPNTVSVAVRNLANVGAAAIYKRHFELKNFDKALYYFSVNRKLREDIIYSTYFKSSVGEIEKSMPSEIAYTACSGYVNLFGNDASDYSEVYVYATERSCREIMDRFPKNRLSKASDYANIIVLKPDRILGSLISESAFDGSAAPVTQIYADLWNMKEWYAHEFEKKLKSRIDGMHGKKILQ